MHLNLFRKTPQDPMEGTPETPCYKQPWLYAAIYCALIVVFTAIYLILPEDSFRTLPTDGINRQGIGKVVESLYFSTITITTLGYGDISPLTPLAQLTVTAEAVLGVTVIGFFLNAVAHSQAVEDSKAEKKKMEELEYRNELIRLTRYNTLIAAKLKRLEIYTSRIVLPMEKRGELCAINRTFTFHDLKDLYQPTLLLCDNVNKTTAEYYFEALHDLKASIEQLIVNINFAYWPSLETLCLKFIDNCNTYDSSEAILTGKNNKQFQAMHHDLIKRWKGEIRYYPSNAINMIVSLYHMIHVSIKFSDDYTAAIGKTNCPPEK